MGLSLLVAMLGISVAACSAVPPDASTSPSDAPTELTATCTPTGLVLSADVVLAQADGVHFRFVDLTGQEAAFVVEMRPGSELGAYLEKVADIPAGPSRLKCAPQDVDERLMPWSVVTVADPAGFYTLDRLDCLDRVQGSLDAGEDAVGERGDPVAIATNAAHGLLPTDVVERAGYQADPGPEVRIRLVRDGRPLSVVEYRPDGVGGWLMSETERCTNQGAGW